MNFLSTKEISRQWGISTRRIAILATEGRIPGARQIEGRWFIPEDALKPGDARKKDALSYNAADEKYCFPFLIETVKSEEQIGKFTSDEKKLYKLCCEFELGEFEESRQIAEKLTQSKNKYIRLGALYYLPMICMYLEDFEASEKYTILFKSECHEITDHRTDIDLLIRIFDTEMNGIDAVLRHNISKDVMASTDDMMPAIAVHKLFVDVYKFCTDGKKPDITSLEIMLRLVEQCGYFYDAMYMHMYISTYYSYVHDEAMERFHIKKGIDMAIEYNLLFSAASSLFYNKECAEKILADYPKEYSDTFDRLGRIFAECRNKYKEYRGTSSVLTHLKDEDYKLVSLCLKGVHVEDMAEYFGLSRSGINKRLAALYAKLGVKSKNQMSKVFFQSLFDW